MARGRPPPAPFPLSPTSSPSFNVRLIGCLCPFSSPCMHAPPHPACLLGLLLTAATFSPSRHHHQTWRWRALSPYATYGGASESVPGCLFDGTGTLYRLFFFVTRPKPQSNAHAQGKPLFSEGIPWARALLWEIKAANVVYAARLRRTLSNDVREQCFFSRLTLYNRS